MQDSSSYCTCQGGLTYREVVRSRLLPGREPLGEGQVELGASSWALGLQPSLVPRSSQLVPSFSPTGPAGSRSAGSAAPAGSPVYLDLAYLPSGGSARLVDEEFFRRVRALCYVISGQDQHKEEGMRAVLDALLAGKQQWDRQLQVCEEWGVGESRDDAGHWGSFRLLALGRAALPVSSCRTQSPVRLV